MEEKDRRRKHKRVRIEWKAAVVFDKTHGKPTLHTQTQDLSLGGAAILSEHPDLTGTVITLLLANPPKNPGEAPKMLKVKAMVVSTMQAKEGPGYRHGLSFIRSPDDGLDILSELLGEHAPQPAAAAAAPAAAPAAGGRLAAIRKMAEAKQSAAPAVDSQEERNRKIDEALQRVYPYLKELSEGLNEANAPIEGKGYDVMGLPEFSGFAWKSGRADFLAKEVGFNKKQWEKVSLNYVMSANKKINVARQFPANDKLRQVLSENRVEFVARDKLNDKGSLLQTDFEINCELKATLELVGKFDTGMLLLKMRNVSHFGTADHVVAPEAVNDTALDELTGFILGETIRVGSLLAKA